MHKRPLVVAALTLATALVLSKLAGLTPSVQAPDASDSARVPGSPGRGSESTSFASIPTPNSEATVKSSTPSQQPAPVRAAVASYAKALDLPIDAISVLSAESVTWPDGSLGCPEPGMQYIQVLTEGFRVQLEARGRRAEYHTDRGSQVLRCETGPGSWAPSPESDATR